jgi:hypothetical protein
MRTWKTLTSCVLVGIAAWSGSLPTSADEAPSSRDRSSSAILATVHDLDLVGQNSARALRERLHTAILLAAEEAVRSFDNQWRTTLRGRLPELIATRR